MRSQCAARGRAKPGQDINHARRKTGFHNQFTYPQRTERRLFRGFQDDCIARRQCRSQLPGLHHQRKIPGNDLGHHADGFVSRIAKIVAADGNCAALNLIRPAGKIAIAGNGERQIHPPRFAQRLAVVERLQLSQFINILFDQIGQPIQQPAPRGRGHSSPGPVFEGCARRCHRHLHIRRIGFGHLADFITGGWIDGGESTAGAAFDPLVVDEELLRERRGGHAV